jgi:hemerythrin-like domain-containing protein
MARSGSKGAGALEMLKQDHEELEKEFRAFEKLDRHLDDAVRELALRACAQLRVHTALEEEVFYPALREAIDDEDILNEAAVEHETAGMLIEQLENMPEDDPNFHATFTVLGEYVRHHVAEEESEIFSAASQSGLDLQALGERMHERREEMAGEAEKTHA